MHNSTWMPSPGEELSCTWESGYSNDSCRVIVIQNPKDVPNFSCLFTVSKVKWHSPLHDLYGTLYTVQ